MTTLAAPPLSLTYLAYTPDAFTYRRRPTRVVMVGDVGVGGSNPIRIQSMTTTRTRDVEATVAQAERLVRAGCEIVRITAPNAQDAAAIGEVRRQLRARGIGAPLVADIHFNPAAALIAADHVEKVRINPGNYADSRTFAVREYTDAEYESELQRIEERFVPLVRKCSALGVAMRIGTNHGSLSDRIMNRFGDTPLGMVESALEFLQIAERHAYRDIILSMKASNPKVMIHAYRLLVARMTELGMDYPLHLGVTEAGNDEDGRIKSAVGIGSLLDDGLGDTIRVSLTEEPEAELPVALRLAAPYNAREPRQYVDGQGIVETRDPYSYARRSSLEQQIGPISLGSAATVRVARLEGAGDPVAAGLALATSEPLGNPPPDIITLGVNQPYDVTQPHDVDINHSEYREQIALLVQSLAARAPDVAVGALIGPHAPAASGGPCDAHLLHWTAMDQPPSPELLEDVRAHRHGLLLETFADGDMIGPSVVRLIDWAQKVVTADLAPPILAIQTSDASATVRAYRLLAARLAAVGLPCPLHLIAPAQANPYERLLRSSVALGSLLCDGIGDSVEIRGGEDRSAVRLAFNVLQASGARISKTEFVACPSCGRTLFDLQPTTDLIKQQMGHLKGVKIAIMGCIVNGPGEMADADFGYVGGAPGKVNLYVGKECVEKNVPQAEADTRLIELLKAHDRWIDPPDLE